MEGSGREGDRPRSEFEDDPAVQVSAHCTTPDRVVFTEDDNTDAWIATDHTVDVER